MNQQELKASRAILGALDGRKRLTWGQQPLCDYEMFNFEDHAQRFASNHRRDHRGCSVRVKRTRTRVLSVDAVQWAVVARVRKEFAD